MALPSPDGIPSLDHLPAAPTRAQRPRQAQQKPTAHTNPGNAAAIDLLRFGCQTAAVADNTTYRRQAPAVYPEPQPQTATIRHV